MKKTTQLLILALFSLLLSGCGGGGGIYYPMQTAVNTIGIEKNPLTKSAVKDYTLVYSFEKESDDEWWRRVERGDKVLNRSCGYFITVNFLGKEYYVYNSRGIDSLRIISAFDRRITVAKFSPPRYIMGIAAFQQRLGDKDYLVVYVEQQATSHSSTLLIFDDKFQIVYQDHLLGAIEIGHTVDKIIVKSENFWYPEGEKVTVNGDWIYHLPSDNKNISGHRADNLF